jgi:hypothetical protein
MFKITLGKGFQLTFADGVTASVQWGPANYCERKNAAFMSPAVAAKNQSWSSVNAEVAAWQGTRETWITKKVFATLGQQIDDEVKGWMDVSAVMAFLNACAAMPKEEKE